MVNLDLGVKPLDDLLHDLVKTDLNGPQIKMYSPKYIFQIALKCERKQELLKLKKNRVRPIFWGRSPIFFFMWPYGP
jgi:hypothetical protein